MKLKAEEASKHKITDHLPRELKQTKKITSFTGKKDVNLFFASEFEAYKFYILEEGIFQSSRLYSRKKFVQLLIKVSKI